MCMETPYERIKALVGGRTAELKRQWEADGIIYENDFGFSSVMLESEWPTIMRFLGEIGCETEGYQTAVIGTEVKGGGWMYAGFNTSCLDFEEVEKMINEKFGQKTL